MIDILGRSISWQDAVLLALIVAVCAVVGFLVRRSRQRQGLPVGLWHGESTRTGAGALVIGAAIIGAAAFVWTLPPTCDGQTMSPGDYCQAYDARSGEPVGDPQSYASFLQNTQSIGLVIGVFGAVVGVTGAWWVGRSLISRSQLTS
jgi:hypothetical protein